MTLEETLEKAKAAIALQSKDNAGILRRKLSLNYYNQENAKEVQQLIDRLFSNDYGKHIKLDARKLFIQPITLVKKISHGWWWLMDNADQDEKERLYALRRITKIPYSTNHVYLYKIQGAGSMIEAAEDIDESDMINELRPSAIEDRKPRLALSPTTTKHPAIIEDCEELKEEETEFLDSMTTIDWEQDVILWLAEARQGCEPLDRLGLSLGELDLEKLRHLCTPYRSNVVLVRHNHAGYRLVFSPDMAKDINK